MKEILELLYQTDKLLTKKIEDICLSNQDILVEGKLLLEAQLEISRAIESLLEVSKEEV